MAFDKITALLPKLILTLLICFAAYIIFFNLGKAPLDNWDEAWYGEMTKEMLQTKNFVVLHWNYEFSFDKAPLPIWTNLFFASIFGFSEFSLRLTSAISGLLIIILVVFYTYKQYGFIPSLFAYATLVLNNLFIWRARSGNIDMLTALLVLLCFFCIASEKKNRFVFLGILFGLLYLTRAAFFLFPIAIFVLYELFYHRKKLKENLRSYLLTLLLTTVIPGIWLFGGYFYAGKPFLDFYLFRSDHDVATVTISSFNTNYIFHTYYSLQRRYAYLFLFGVLFLLAKIKNPQNFLLLLFSTLLIVFLSFGYKNNNWYLLPAIPFWSITIAFCISEILSFIKRFRFAFLVKAGMILVVLVLSYKTYTVNIVPIMDTSSATGEKAAGIYIQNHATPTVIIVRLDHLYPSLLYYANRKVLSSPENNTTTERNFISRQDLVNGILKKKFMWVSGTNKDIDTFLQQNSKFLDYQRIPVTKEEALLQIKE